jgi:hypothetical protein
MVAEPGRISIVASVGAAAERRCFGTTCSSAVPRTEVLPIVRAPVTVCRPRWLAAHVAALHEPSLRAMEPLLAVNAIENLVRVVTSPMRRPEASKATAEYATR